MYRKRLVQLQRGVCSFQETKLGRRIRRRSNVRYEHAIPNVASDREMGQQDEGGEGGVVGAWFVWERW